MEFWKGHALGNDYIVVAADEGEVPAPGLIEALCDRHRGVGGDGLLVADLSVEPVGLRIFNPDGSEAEKSGNGLRIFAAWLHGRGMIGSDPVLVSLPTATIELRVEAAAQDGTLSVQVDMGRVSFHAGDIPFRGAQPDSMMLDAPLTVPAETGKDEVRVHLVSIGNPHCVVFSDDLDPERFRRLAPRIQAHPAFEHGINVQFARPVGGGALEARIWERGAGETAASGSSACAVAAAALRSGRVQERRINVRMEGGTVTVEIERDWRVHLTGEARMVFRGEIRDNVLEGWRRVAVVED